MDILDDFIKLEEKEKARATQLIVNIVFHFLYLMFF